MSNVVPTRIAVALLGRVLVANPVGAQLVEPPGALSKALVVSLALAGPDGVSSTRLVDEVWGGTPPGSPRSALQTLVSRVRQSSVPGLIDSAPSGYRLGAGVFTDLGEARRLLGGALRAAPDDAPSAEAALTEALSLWRGSPGADLVDGLLRDELARTAEFLLRSLVVARAASRVAIGDHDGALADIETAGSGDDLLELRLRALAGSGRRAEALRLFAAHRHALADELGIDPAPSLVALHARLLQDEPAPAPAAAVTVPAGRSRTSGLRRAPNQLVGRAADVDAVVASLAESRLVTILGPGGLGKTRLAHEVGWRVSERSGSSVVVVELGAVRSAADVAGAIAAPLGIRDSSVARLSRGEVPSRLDIRDRILTALAEKPTLIVLDNCEHLIVTAAEWAADILSSTAGVTILATSRAPLAITAERVSPLPPLPSTGAAAALFDERARQARPGALLPRDVVERLCRRLDGLPLAIELAAARIRSMPVDEIERRLDNRFALLTTGDRTAPERHRTLTAVIDWSWNLLGSSEQRLLRRLAPLPGGFSPEAAAKVGVGTAAGSEQDAEGVADDLDALVAQSLVSVVEQPGSGRLRYRMLETVREFGLARLEEAGEALLVRDALRLWAVEFASVTLEELNGSEQVRIVAGVNAEQDNLVAILRGALADGRRDVVVVLFAALAYYWTLRGNQPAVAEFSGTVVRALIGHSPAREHRDAAILGLTLAGGLTLFDDRRTGMVALDLLRRIHVDGPAEDPLVELMSALVLATTVDMAAFETLLDSGLRSDHPGIIEITALISSQVRENQGYVDESLRLAERSRTLAAAAGHVWSEATASGQIAELHMQRGRAADCLHWAERSQVGLEDMGATADVRRNEWLIALALLGLGRIDEARVTFERLADHDDSASGSDGEDLSMVSRAGIAEVALAEGRAPAGLAAYDLAVAETRSTSHFSPWRELVAAASLAAKVTVDGADRGATDRLATRLRARVIAITRVPGAFRDVPILGSCAFALGLWLRWPGRAPSDQDRLIGLRLMALGERVGGRQDLGSLVHAPRFAELEGLEAEALRAFRSDAAALAPPAALDAAVALLVAYRRR